MMQVLVFGDSIAFGEGDLKAGGWAERLRVFLKSKGIRLHNFGVSGDTSGDLLRRIRRNIKSKSGEKKNTTIIIAIGTNDSQFLRSTKNFRVRPARFGSNLKKLLRIAKKHSSKQAFVGLFPVDEARTAPIPWNRNKSYRNQYIRKYNSIIKSFCRKNRVRFIDIFGSFSRRNYRKLLKDGLHPNAEGHRKMFETIKKFLMKNRMLYPK